MADLLIRGIDPAAMKALRVRAAEHGRSQQAEARAILEAALAPPSKEWWLRLREAASAAEGVNLPLPERHRPRAVDTAGWL